MKNLIFDFYVPISTVFIPGGLLLLGLGMLIWPAHSRRSDTLSSVLIYISIVALGMSEDIKHLSVLGFVHAATAVGIVCFSIRYFNTRVSYLLWIPIFFTCLVIVFNLLNHDIGLELMGRWTHTQ